MFGFFKKVRQYNSDNFDLSNTKDFSVFCNLVDTINDFDFAVEKMLIVYNGDCSKATLHVETKNETIEVWLIKNGFVEA